eukprot:SAG31_NODE_5323_length_2609_cov_3.546215_3_plen_129_part_00
MDYPGESLDLSIELIVQASGAGGAASLSSATVPSPKFDRCTCALLPAVNGPDPARFDVPSDFFEVSAAEAMSEMTAAKTKREAELVLRTKAMRDKEVASRKRRYKRALLRVRFTDGTILQGIFRPGTP